MIQRASESYLMRLTMRAEEGGHWHLHHRGINAPGVKEQAKLKFATEVTLTPRVDDGRWVVDCPHCGGAQLGAPEWTRFLCCDCANVAFKGRWLAVEWPSAELVEAGEALLRVRPDPATRHWDPTKETIGALKAENAFLGGLVDRKTGAVAGDTGAKDDARMIPSGPTLPMLSEET